MASQKYNSVHEVPAAWRVIGHGRLTLDQINTMVSAAEDSGEPFAVSLSKLRQEVVDTHEIVDGFWVKEDQ